MLGKIDVSDIVRDHFRTLVTYGTNRRSLSDLVLFLGLPAVMAVGVWLVRVLLTDSAVTVLITAISVLGGLLFNVLVLIHTVAARFEAPTGRRDRYLFLCQVYSNIAYAILVSLVALLPLTGIVLVRDGTWKMVLSVTAVFLTVHLGLTLLMVLKRLHALLSIELRKPPAP